MYDPEIHHRQSVRLKGYDYSQKGLYFITICTENRKHLFGEIIHDCGMQLNIAGNMIAQIWYEIPHYLKNTRLHEFVIMPNHVHGIIEITTISPVGADSISAQKQADSIPAHDWADMESAPTTLGDIVQMFKRYTTIEYIKMVKNGILPRFDKRIWQRNYWEHIIRNEHEFYQISEYIQQNPEKWDYDKLNGGTGNVVLDETELYGEEKWMI